MLRSMYYVSWIDLSSMQDSTTAANSDHIHVLGILWALHMLKRRLCQTRKRVH